MGVHGTLERAFHLSQIGNCRGPWLAFGGDYSPTAPPLRVADTHGAQNATAHRLVFFGPSGKASLAHIEKATQLFSDQGGISRAFQGF